jgi:hypothetical protein
MSAKIISAGARASDPKGLTPSRPVLNLSGPKLRGAFERLINASEQLGGVERFAEAVQLKAKVFQDRLGEGRVAALSRAQFDEIVPLMATVRRRIAPLIDGRHWETTHAAIVALLDKAHDTTLADERIARFESVLRSAFSSPLAGEEKRSSSRFLRDLAAEILHNTLPEHYPLMQRWVWDTKANTGVIREIWHDPVAGDDVDHIVIDLADGYEAHLMLREELSQFLADNGVFRDMLWHVDLVSAQIYGDYINAQGGAYLKTDFSAQADPLEHTRRILGLDRVGGKRFGVRAIDGEATATAPTKLLT